MIPAAIELIVYRGDTVVLELVYQTDDDEPTPIDLTGYTARAQFRAKLSATTPLFEITEADDIGLGGPLGTIVLTLTPTNTKLLKADAVWDLELTDSSGVVTTIANGSIDFIEDVTR